MASFVTEVLAHSGSLEKEDLGTRISHLTRRVEEIKVQAGKPLAVRLKRDAGSLGDGTEGRGAKGGQRGCGRVRCGAGWGG
ncbi:unnamed protein product [Pipistrellus nathusii]|uniref:Uncharacterized protein n=1 Tax=Pipistrellus nathusii TaxID=59473 RepID=A0ABP0AF33_PIPNA